MKEIKQVLILSGGHGTRMSKQLNPQGCKSFIEYAGQSMLGHLIDALIEGGIKDFVFATNKHSDQKVKEIVSVKNIKSPVIVVSDGKYRGVAHEVKDLLENRFLMVCGHHPVSATHVKSMIESSKVYRQVMSGYDNNLYTMDKSKRIIQTGDDLEFVDLNIKSVSDDHIYIRNPYVLSKDIIESVHDGGYQETFSYYIFQKNYHGEKIGVVKANMPPEFDYDREFEKTKMFLDSHSC